MSALSFMNSWSSWTKTPGFLLAVLFTIVFTVNLSFLWWSIEDDPIYHGWESCKRPVRIPSLLNNISPPWLGFFWSSWDPSRQKQQEKDMDNLMFLEEKWRIFGAFDIVFVCGRGLLAVGSSPQLTNESIKDEASHMDVSLSSSIWSPTLLTIQLLLFSLIHRVTCTKGLGQGNPIWTQQDPLLN